MSNPVIKAFFLGKALAETISEKIEDTINQTLSEVGKFDAEQREKLRQFTNEVMAKADRELYNQGVVKDGSTTRTTSRSESPQDRQEMIDELRAEIARLRADLKIYTDQSS